MVRNTRNSSRRSTAAGNTETQPSALSNETAPSNNSEIATSVPSIADSELTAVTSPTPRDHSSDEEIIPEDGKYSTIEMLSTALSMERDQVVSRKINSAMWFPCLFEEDATLSFRFNTHLNKRYASAIAQSAGHFNPTVTPQEDWPTFVKQLTSHLAPYAPEGISHEQYAKTLKRHFSPTEWEYIYEDRIVNRTTHKQKSAICTTLVYWYSQRCYNMESRVRDFSMHLNHSDLSSYAESVIKVNNLSQELNKKTSHRNYLLLLQIVIPWTPEERHEFFVVRSILNEFDAPIYDKITASIVAEAVSQTNKIVKNRRLFKRPWLSQSTEKTEENDYKKNSIRSIFSRRKSLEN